MLRFCPACGDRLIRENIVRYCTNCGEELTDFLPAAVSAPPVSAAPSNPAIITELHREQCISPGSLRTALPTAYYSLVLKSGGDKDRLITRLSKVLCRSNLATRLAVELIPCVILYKSRQPNIQAVTAIFEDEQLHYAVVEGDFEAVRPSVANTPALAGLDSELQAILENTPDNLWLGEEIHIAVPMVEKNGELFALIATNGALYLFRRPLIGMRPEWVIIPYSRLANAVLHHHNGGELELVYKEYGYEEWLKIGNAGQLAGLYQYLQQRLL